MKNRRVMRGFSLIEVLIALAILAVTLAAGSRAMGALMASSERQSDTLLSQLCAENQIAQLRLSRTYPGAGDQRFVCEQGGQQFEGTLGIATTPNPNFRRVDVRVFKASVGPSAALQTDARPELFHLRTIVSRL